MDQTIRQILKRHLVLTVALCLSACATTNAPVSDSEPAVALESVPPGIAEAPIAQPEPADTPTTSPISIPSSEPVSTVAPDIEDDTELELLIPQEPEPTPIPSGAFSGLNLWANADPTPALTAFQKTCNIWQRRPDENWLNSDLPAFGQYKDWRGACRSALNIKASRSNAVRFFQSHFEPVSIGADTGLLTAYYAPNLPVRRVASLEFSEPILARPTDPRKQSLARKDISVTTSTVLGYGRPIDVFFLHIQGSGQIKFPDGSVYRAAFDGHNNRPYTSIGRVLIKRGELHKDKASKQDIEDWMAKAGYLKTKELMAENARYVFFKTEHIVPGEGPKGAMGIPLTDMGSLAVDPKSFPYGAVIWVEGKFPAGPGDYVGKDAGHLLIAQDTGGAIKGKKRGDVYFGSGDAAGAVAGVMKHHAAWRLFLPVALALNAASIS